MDVLTNFLENSSIHGLAFISRTQAFRRAFWLCVVLTGFFAASVIISESFRNWNETPVITTLETLPISDVIFPKVTVCPPPNTYTNLNYDLMKAENKNIVNFLINNENSVNNYDWEATIDRIWYDLTENIFDAEYEQAWKWYFEETNKYSNWYHGYSKENNPLKTFIKISESQMKDEDDLTNKDQRVLDRGSIHTISTCAISGTINTPRFGKPFERSVFINPTYSQHIYSIIIDFIGINVTNDEKVTVNLNIEMNLNINERVELCGYKLEKSEFIMLEINCEHRECKSIKGEAEDWEEYVTFCENETQIKLELIREEYNEEELDVAALLSMTGFRVTWNYSDNVISSKSLYNNANFIKTANFLGKYKSTEKLISEIRDEKISLELEKEKSNGTEIYPNYILRKVKSRINKEGLKEIDTKDILSDENLRNSANLSVYLFTQPRALWNPAIEFFKDALSHKTLRGTLLLTSNIHPSNFFEETVKRILLQVLADYMEFEFLDIDNVSFLQKLQESGSVEGIPQIYIM